MAEIRVGLSCYPAGDGHGMHVPTEYLHAVVRAGGVPLMLPHTSGEESERWAHAWVGVLDALVLIGGGDIDPARHRTDTHPALYSLSVARDNTELALFNAARQQRLPTLAICRGLQLINVACGGSLHLHLPDVVGDQVAHRAPPRQPTAHQVRIAPASRLAALIGTQAYVQSWHHQAIDRLGSGIRAVAWAEDGVIEAIEIDGHPEICAVQWHPELSAASDAQQQALFDHLVASARMAGSTGRPHEE
ncbi:gamma-glutamyl-gamma-aminobutyrate hydrolase family protein [Craterilacuibacter sp. RT1T]|uniref:gamma-glutamyl-gamma-aminobutyrate hydrolase family protein n=1 Tax=Craterilacuibacter sp. RT1T TaxID=2942211 RepID=UPI00201C49E4|nr:gamma-glutamyl-gamma-aminobutyrate hydrolase family protein [Craterilacuibacter sp. RT1T]MCL6262924.1 gamma-glutamyl-gamma-aminobutyrate hydrolase family protein [Craterilacuibacter sp. RT1T]